MAKTDTVSDTKTTALAPNDIDERALYLDGNGASDPEADAKAIAARILTATTAEEVFGGPGTLVATEDLIGKPFTLVDVEYRESDYEGSPAYALLSIQPWGASNTVLVSCGARNVMASAYKGKALGLLPRGPLTITARDTRKGFTVLWLQDLDQAKADNATSVIDTGVVEEPFS